MTKFHISSYRAFTTFTTGLLLTSCATQKESVENAKPLNIIYIMSDDHTEQMIGAYSGKVGYTPHIDRIASEGVDSKQ